MSRPSLRAPPFRFDPTAQVTSLEHQFCRAPASPSGSRCRSLQRCRFPEHSHGFGQRGGRALDELPVEDVVVKGDCQGAGIVGACVEHRDRVRPRRVEQAGRQAHTPARHGTSSPVSRPISEYITSPGAPIRRTDGAATSAANPSIAFAETIAIPASGVPETISPSNRAASADIGSSSAAGMSSPIMKLAFAVCPSGW